MNRVAIATCRGLDTDPSSRFQGANVDPDSPFLLRALAEVGLRGELCVWDDLEVRWDDYALVVVRSTWDYSSRHKDFLDWARGVARLLNPFEVLEYSSDKHYLEDLGRAGHRIVPSIFCDVGHVASFPSGDFVVKPCVGAGSIDAERYRAHQMLEASEHVRRLHAMGRDVLIQPYVASVDEVGERALVFIDGEFSHAMTKGAMLDRPAPERDALFRIEQMSVAQGEPDAVAFATRILRDLDFADLLYARVDVVRADTGWALMELELVEPSLFLQFNELAPQRLATGIAKRVASL